MSTKEVKIPLRFNKDNLRLTKSVVGRGQFAISYILGRIILDGSNPCSVPLKRHHPQKYPLVLVKSVTNDDGERCFKALRREINILEDLRSNPHILNLIGACTTELKNRELYLVFELCANGNLLKFIRRCNPSSEFEFDSIRSTVTHTERGPVLTLTRHRLLQWCYEIASGMEYLAGKRIWHNDLAARNVLVTSQWHTKICNFGLSQKDLHDDDQCTTTGSSSLTSTKSSSSPSTSTTRMLSPHTLPLTVLPLKWMAPEVIQHLQYSEKSDVWSFSITMWEICSLGEIPYRDWVVDEDFWRTLSKSIRLEKPRFCANDTWTTVNSCWEYRPEDRPTFAEVRRELQRLLKVKMSQRGKGETCNNRTVNIYALKAKLASS